MVKRKTKKKKAIKKKSPSKTTKRNKRDICDRYVEKEKCHRCLDLSRALLLSGELSPDELKKIRKIRKAIKSRKSISDSISIPNKAQMLVKLLGDDWKAIGLSLEETLDTEARKFKDMPKNNINEGEEI